MTAPGFGLLAILPLAGLFTMRYRRILPGLDRRARRTARVKAAVFLAATGIGSGTLKAFGGVLPLPWTWTLLVVWLGWYGLFRCLRGGLPTDR